MAKLRKEDIFSESYLAAVKKANDDLLILLGSFKKLGKEAKKLGSEVKAAKSFDDLSKKAKTASDTVTKLTTEEKKLITAQKALAFQTSDAGKKLAILNEQKRRATAENRKYAKSQLESVKSTNTWRNALKSFQFRFNALGNLIAQAAATVFRQFVRVVRQSVNVIIDMDKSTARLSAIVGKTRKEIADLTKQAKRLGATTQYTATQITGLHIELGKLGFTANEIKAATPGIQKFATAVDTDLASAAKTAGAAIRVFGLNASESEDAVATLAVATTKSGLTFEDFDTILSTAGVTAKAYGFKLADVISLTGELKTAGFEANKAATATRNILLNLADANGDLAKELGGSVRSFDGLIDGLISADKAGISLSKALDLTDKRSVNAFSRFLEGAEAARKLRDNISDVNDELQIMVDKQLDTVAGDIDLLKSAWEGFILAMSSDGGMLRTVLQFLTNAVLQVSNLDLAFRKFHKQNVEQLERSFLLLESLTNKQGTEFSKILEAYSGKTVRQLEADRDAIIFHFSEIRGINKKEAEALFNEFVKQQKAKEDFEFQSLLDQNERIAREEEKRRNLEESGEGEKIENINIFKAEIAELQKLRNDASLSEVGAINREIQILQEKVRAYTEAGKVILPEIDKINKAISEAFDFGEIDFGDVEASDAMTKQLIAMGEAAAESEIETERKKIQELQELNEEAYKQGEISFTTYQDNLNKIREEAEERAAPIISKSFELANRLATEFSNLFEIQKQKELSAVGDNAKKREEIEKKYRKKQRLMALTQAAIDGASSIMKTKAQLGLPLAIPFMIADGIITLAQMAVIATNKFAKGTDSSPEGPAWTGEKGSELMIDKKGNIGLSPAKPTLTYLEQGTKVIPADITRELLGYTNVIQGAGTSKDNVVMAVMDRLDNSIAGLKREIKNKPVIASTMTPAGILTAVHKGNTTIKKLDKYFK